MRGVTVEMLVDGRPVRKVRHSTGMYLPIAEGDRFTIRIRNDTRENIVAVLSVDGLNAVTGEPASEKDSGYRIEARHQVEIEGFQVSDHETRDFVVGENNPALYMNKTYADKATGSTKNNGVIGVAIIPEKRRRVRRDPYLVTGRTDPTKTSVPISSQNELDRIMRECDAGAARESEREELTSGGIVLPDAHVDNCLDFDGAEYSCSAVPSPRRLSAEPATKGSVGTKMGDKRYSPVVRVDFDPDYSRVSKVVLYYDTVRSLQERGILAMEENPNPFPADPSHTYCAEL